MNHPKPRTLLNLIQSLGHPVCQFNYDRRCPWERGMEEVAKATIAAVMPEKQFRRSIPEIEGYSEGIDDGWDLAINTMQQMAATWLGSEEGEENHE